MGSMFRIAWETVYPVGATALGVLAVAGAEPAFGPDRGATDRTCCCFGRRPRCMPRSSSRSRRIAMRPTEAAGFSTAAGTASQGTHLRSCRHVRARGACGCAPSSGLLSNARRVRRCCCGIDPWRRLDCSHDSRGRPEAMGSRAAISDHRRVLYSAAAATATVTAAVGNGANSLGHSYSRDVGASQSRSGRDCSSTERLLIGGYRTQRMWLRLKTRRLIKDYGLVRTEETDGPEESLNRGTGAHSGAHTAGRAMLSRSPHVSKTVGRRFEPCRPCYVAKGTLGQ